MRVKNKIGPPIDPWGTSHFKTSQVSKTSVESMKIPKVYSDSGLVNFIYKMD